MCHIATRERLAIQLSGHVWVGVGVLLANMLQRWSKAAVKLSAHESAFYVGYCIGFLDPQPLITPGGDDAPTCHAI